LPVAGRSLITLCGPILLNKRGSITEVFTADVVRSFYFLSERASTLPFRTWVDPAKAVFAATFHGAAIAAAPEG
jgi:hypothetical protein